MPVRKVLFPPYRVLGRSVVSDRGRNRGRRKGWQTAIREVREETGIELSEIWSADILEQFYEADKECITLVPVFDSTVTTDTTVTLNDEHDAYEWVSFEKANTMLSFPGQQRPGC